jgi:asparagine synthase (glutamine-hydrolysing)
MCGVAGLVSTRGPVPRAVAELLRDNMFSRGPDGTGDFAEGGVALTMRRLSIIDLAHGWQPLTSRDRRVIAFQNGEIYNYRSLRDALGRAGYAFRTGSDTEVIAHGYDAWGIDGLLERIDGMYALAIYDRDSRRLHLARDRLGEKPLFFALRDGWFGYSSDLAGIAALPWVDLDAIDTLALDRYLALHFTPGRRTLFRDIRRLLPGERATLDVDTLALETRRYWFPDATPAAPIGDDELASLLQGAVESRLVADVPVGVFLSGGLDSSLIAAIAARAAPSIDTFSIGFASAKHDERAAARAVASAVGSTHHEFRFDEAHFVDLVPQVAAALDEPLGDQAMLPLHWLCREARKTVTVALSGEGADEVFGGYAYYRSFIAKPGWRERIGHLVRGRPAAAPGEASTSVIDDRRLATASGFPLISDRALRNRLLGRPVPPVQGSDEWDVELVRRLDAVRDPLARATLADLTTWLPDDLLVKFDRMAMAHSLEGRAPYLDPALVHAGLARLRAGDRMRPDQSKVALRRIARRWLPATLLERPKQGFVLPMRAWLSTWFAGTDDLYGYCREALEGILETDVLAEVIADDVRGGVRNERLLFALLMLCEWRKSFRRRSLSLRERYAAALRNPSPAA